MITRWKKEFLERAPQLFDKTLPADKEEKDLEKLYAKIGQLEMEREFLKKNLKKLGL
jgi:transposase